MKKLHIITLCTLLSCGATTWSAESAEAICATGTSEETDEALTFAKKQLEIVKFELGISAEQNRKEKGKAVVEAIEKMKKSNAPTKRVLGPLALIRETLEETPEAQILRYKQKEGTIDRLLLNVAMEDERPYPMNLLMQLLTYASGETE